MLKLQPKRQLYDFYIRTFDMSKKYFFWPHTLLFVIFACIKTYRLVLLFISALKPWLQSSLRHKVAQSGIRLSREDPPPVCVNTHSHQNRAAGSWWRSSKMTWTDRWRAAPLSHLLLNSNTTIGCRGILGFPESYDVNAINPTAATLCINHCSWMVEFTDVLFLPKWLTFYWRKRWSLKSSRRPFSR